MYLQNNKNHRNEISNIDETIKYKSKIYILLLNSIFSKEKNRMKQV